MDDAHCPAFYVREEWGEGGVTWVRTFNKMFKLPSRQKKFQVCNLEVKENGPQLEHNSLKHFFLSLDLIYLKAKLGF